MLKRDGLFVTFVHRSFQEYFCAYFLSRADGINLFSVLDNLSERGSSEQCMSLLFDMSPDRVLFGWIGPLLESIRPDLARVKSSNDVAGFLNLFYQGIQVGRDYSMRAP